MNAPQRIVVVGNSGSGKTSLARRIARSLDADHVELDAIHHLENWTPIARDQMRSIVEERIASEWWVVDGNYGSLVQDLVFAAADTVVWLDLPRRVVMPRILRRTLGRMVFRRELWNGNRERFRNLVDRRPEENIILWAWSQHEAYRAGYERKMSDVSNAHLDWIRLTSRAAVKEWLAGIESARARPSGPSPLSGSPPS